MNYCFSVKTAGIDIKIAFKLIIAKKNVKNTTLFIYTLRFNKET